MHRTLFIAAVVGLFALTPSAADASCCDQAGHAAHHAGTCDQPCCKDHGKAKDTAMLVPMEMDPQLVPAPPVRQLADVWFHNPVLVGRSILQGRYVIEHDNDRMARGEPCTHIYRYEDQATPVAAFHCTHLERDRADQTLVVVVATADAGMKKVVEFQFAGETAAHGVPVR
jgi:hypothetical protein